MVPWRVALANTIWQQAVHGYWQAFKSRFFKRCSWASVQQQASLLVWLESCLFLSMSLTAFNYEPATVHDRAKSRQAHGKFISCPALTSNVSTSLVEVSKAAYRP